MKIREFTAAKESDATPFKLKFSEPSKSSGNSFSILVGANGTRKSRTLRDLVDIVVPGQFAEHALIERSAGKIRFWEPSAIPLVLAVSGVATDRFPSRMTARKRARGSRVRYSYIGPRTDNNLVSRVQAVQQLAIALIADPQVLVDRSEQLRSAFPIVGIDPGIYFELRTENVTEAPWSLAKLRQRIDLSRVSLDEEWQADILKRTLIFLRRRKRSEIRFELTDVELLDLGGEDADVLHLLLQAGILRVSACHAIHAMGHTVDVGELSSGQWHMLSSLLFVAATVQDNTLVLVDEPENSLHPEWQQAYLPLLQHAISASTGVHVVISTHSPHVASSLSPDAAEVIGLKTSRHRIIAEPLESGTYGWTADDILRVAFGLDSSRSMEFTKKVDDALRLFAKGNRKDPELVKQVKALQFAAENLPKEDAVREMIITMSTLINQKAEA